MQCAVTAQTNPVGRRWLCPRLPAPSSTEPANRDGLHYTLKSHSLIVRAFLLNSGSQSIRTTVLVTATSLLQRALLLFPQSNAPEKISVSNRHSPHDYSALLSLPAQCHWAFDTSQWTTKSQNILAFTRGISRIRRTFRCYLSVRLITTVTVSSRRYL
jgi:hypothetical protein